MPLSHLSQSFKIHPVGQGFFYTCNINYSEGNKPFRFVFDCGSLNRRNAEDAVDLYLNQNFSDKTQMLDLLVVSHFDEDHINFLPRLLKEIKVKKIITPFVSMEERLVLVLRAMTNSEGDKVNQIDDQTLTDMLDASSLLRYLGEGGELIIIKSDPVNPPFNIEETKFNEEKQRISPEATFSFPGISKKQKIPGAIKQTTVKDSKKGTMAVHGTSIMEFLFYRKQVGTADDKFFNKVYELFIRNHSEEFSKPNKPTIDELVNVIKKVSSATEIKDIFRIAAGKVSGILISISKLTDMNTTALCLLHHNPQSLFRKIQDEAVQALGLIGTFNFTMMINNIESTADIPNNKNWVERFVINHPYNTLVMPNTMLTSDSFLFAENDVKEFKKRYNQYWNKFWLFQLPHHGAARNTDLRLLNLIPKHVFGFINYGIEKTWGGTWRHPSPKLLENLMLTDLQLTFLKINENMGLEFKLEVEQL